MRSVNLTETTFLDFWAGCLVIGKPFSIERSRHGHSSPLSGTKDSPDVTWPESRSMLILGTSLVYDSAALRS
jgi:hypothetical protein